MKPFLLLATREHDAASDGEYAAVLRYGKLTRDTLHRIRLERDPMPDIDLDDFSGVIVGGSPFNTSDPDNAKSDLQRRVEAEIGGLLDRIIEADFPFFGACYGVGTLGTHTGGIVDHTYGEPVGPVVVELTDDGLADPLLAGLPAQFDAFVGHKEGVTQLPPDAVLLATSASAPTQMFRIKQNLYATQFHPELDLEGLLERIRIYDGYGYFAPSEKADVIERVKSRPIIHPHKILENFVTRYAR